MDRGTGEAYGSTWKHVNANEGAAGAARVLRSVGRMLRNTYVGARRR